MLVGLYEAVKDSLSDWRQKAETHQNIYDLYVDSDNYPFSFDVFVPLALGNIQTIIPRFVNALLYRHPMVRPVSEHPMTPPESLTALDRLLNKRWMVDARTWFDLLMMVHEGKVIGHAGGKVGFRNQKQKKKFSKEITDAFGTPLGRKVEEYFVSVVNRPILHHRPMFNILPDTERIHTDDMRFVGEEIIMGVDELRYSDVDYENLDELEELGDWPVTGTEWGTVTDARGVSRVSQEIASYFKPRHILEFTIRVPTRQGIEIHLITVGNLRVLLRDDIIDYWPWIFFRNDPRHHEWHGRSEIDAIRDLNFAINDVLNMTLENMLMSLTKMWLIGEDAEADLNQFVLEPFGLMQVADINQVKPISFEDINSSPFRVEQFLLQQANQVSGIHDMLRGATAPRQEFATTVMALQAAAEAKVDSAIKLADKTWLNPIAKTFTECGQAYLEEPEYIPNPDGGFYEIDLSMIQGMVGFDCPSVVAGIPETERASLNDFMAIAGTIVPELAAEPYLPFRINLLMAAARTHVGLEHVVEQLERIKTDHERATGAAAAGGQPGLLSNAGAGMAGFANAIAASQAQYAQGTNGTG